MESKTYSGYSHSERIRWIVAFSLIAVLLVGMAVSFSLIFSLKKEENRPQNDFVAETVNSEHIRLTMSTYATVAADNSVSKTIVATVLPETAEKPIQSENAVNYFFHSFLPPNFYFFAVFGVAKEARNGKRNIFCKV